MSGGSEKVRVLVVGAGISGLTAAIALREQGHAVCVIERRPGPSSEGYMIDFFGPGFDVADRMGLLPILETIHYPVESLHFIDWRGRNTASLQYAKLRDTVFHGRHFNFMRGDLERVLLERLGPGAVRFGIAPRKVKPSPSGAAVITSDGACQWFDVVIGADGARSAVRDLAFPHPDSHVTYLGCHTAAYVIQGTPLGAAPHSFTSMTAPGLTAAIYPIRGNRTAAFFAHRSEAPIQTRSSSTCKIELEAIYRGQGGIADVLLDHFPANGDVYFDDVFQVEVAHWSRGRIALIGDACGCVSLVAGQGASMAMTGAWILAKELGPVGDSDVSHALERYEARVRPAVETRQRSGRRNVRWFLPESNFAIWLRDRMTIIGAKRPFAGIVGRSLGASALPPV